jgi:hypothetical protein
LKKTLSLSSTPTPPANPLSLFLGFSSAPPVPSSLFSSPTPAPPAPFSLSPARRELRRGSLLLPLPSPSLPPPRSTPRREERIRRGGASEVGPAQGRSGSGEAGRGRAPGRPPYIPGDARTSGELGGDGERSRGAANLPASAPSPVPPRQCASSVGPAPQPIASRPPQSSAESPRRSRGVRRIRGIQEPLRVV